MINTSHCLVETPPKDLDFAKWQNLVNMVAKLFDSASGVIVQLRREEFNVVSTSENKDNFLQVNTSWSWEEKSFCRHIVESNDKIYVNNPKSCDVWSKAPYVENGPVRSYLGYPLYWPDGTIFGSFCVIDTKETDYPETLIEMLEQLKMLVESELKHIFDKQEIKALLAEKIDVMQLVEQTTEKSAVVKESLSLQESINTVTLASLVDSVIRIDEQGTILSCNAATTTMFGYSDEELIGQNIKILCEPSHAKHHDQYLARYKETRKASIIGIGRQVSALHKNGTIFPIHLSVSEIYIGNSLQFIGLINDISEKVQYEELLKQLALYDALTNCANRNLLSERFDYELAKAQREGAKFSIAYLDLDKFKPINDTYGHEAGDIILQTTVKRIQRTIRSHDLVARVGGDEFVVLFNNRINSQYMKEKLLESVLAPVQYNGELINVSASIGIATYPQDGNSLKEMMRVADERMYINKSSKS